MKTQECKSGPRSQHLHGHYPMLTSQPLVGWEIKCPWPVPPPPWCTHHLRKAQLTPVFPLDHELHEGRLGCCVSRVFPAPGVAAGAQEGLREYQQRRERTSASSEGHARSGVQGESTVYSCNGATYVDLCPHPVTSEVW